MPRPAIPFMSRIAPDVVDGFAVGTSPAGEA
jgi:hypothetical protein